MALGSVSQNIYDYMKSGIMSGMWDNQERINEQHLAKQLGVSRTSVRKAMKVLEGEGLLQALDNRGMIVTYLTDRDIAEVYQCRLALELEWFQKIQEQITHQDLLAVLRHLNQLKVLEESGQMIDIWQVEQDFYHRLFDAVDLPVYQDMLMIAFKRLRSLESSQLVSARNQQIFLRYYRQIVLCLNHANQQILYKVVKQTLEFSQTLAMQSLQLNPYPAQQETDHRALQGQMFVCQEEACPLLTAFMRPS